MGSLNCCSLYVGLYYTYYHHLPCHHFRQFINRLISLLPLYLNHFYPKRISSITIKPFLLNVLIFFTFSIFSSNQFASFSQTISSLTRSCIFIVIFLSCTLSILFESLLHFCSLIIR
jgi:hypothetical protein